MGNTSSLEKSDLEYFDKGKIENLKFWSRLGGMPSIKGLEILDVGCGHGSLCVEVASRGAKKVLGIDTDQQRIDFAIKNIEYSYPQLKGVVEFKCCEIFELTKSEFDVIISKDSFEHILNLDSVLAEIRRRLKVNGRLYVGFGPLYNSPYGDHKRTEAVLPWGHLIFPEPLLINKLNKYRANKVENIYELGLNKLSLAEYKKLFYNCGLRVLYFHVNVNNNPISKLFSLIRRIPFLEEFFSHNLYCILEKTDRDVIFNESSQKHRE